MTCCTYRTQYRLSFIAMIILTTVLCLAKVFIGYKEKSLSLIADSFHLTSDVAAFVVGFFALKFSEKRVEGKYTFGTVRAEILGAMVNAIFLIAICFGLSVESLKRLVIPYRIKNPEPVLIVGIIGLVINAIGLYLFRCNDFRCHTTKKKTDQAFKKFTSDPKSEDSDVPNPSSRLMESHEEYKTQESRYARPSHQLNIHAVFLHILQHVFVAMIVITSALIVMYAKGGWTVYIDPSLSLVVVVFILKTSVPLLKECIAIFMQTVPASIQLKNLEEKLVKIIPEVAGVHELHIWQLAGDQIVGSAHIVFLSHKMYNRKSIKKVEAFFFKEGISSLTIQPEFSEVTQRHSEDDFNLGRNRIQNDCLLLCTEKKCAYLTCCETPKKILAKLQESEL